MKRKIIVFFFLLSCFQFSFSQNQTNFWYFGFLAGIDFTGGTPTVLTNGTTDTNEGTASIADSAGNLLFYTEGINVYNRNNILMPNGSGLLGDVSTTQTIIVPNPGNNTLFYIFTLDDEGGPGGLNYSVVDMSLQGGNGDVTVKNNFLHSSMTEKLAATYHCNNHDIWVMTHVWHSNQFLAYLVTDSGISVPVVSSVGMNHTDVHGQLKFNNAGDKIACTRDSVLIPFPVSSAIPSVDLLDFNNSTGVVSNPRSLTFNNHHHTYGVEFSPDNSKLYATYYDVTGVTGGTSGLYQFDLTTTNIDSSKLVIATSFDQDMYGLQMASDNKIYVARNNQPFLSVINDPNLTGPACNYVDNAVNLDPGGSGLPKSKLGLPGFVQSFFNPAFPNIPCTSSSIDADFQISDTIICKGQCINFTDLSSGTVTSHSWTFSGANPSASSAVNPSNICYSSSGTFNVRLIVSDGTSTDTLLKTVIVRPLPTVNAGPDATIAPGTSVTIHATGNATSFSWTPATGLSGTNIQDPAASPSVTTTYTVTGTDANNCSVQDEVTIFVELPCGEIFIPTAFSPNGDGENEIECVLGNCVVYMHFAIYDRWGEKVFETTDQKACWDGKFKGELMNTATFVYYFNATLVSGEEISRKGNISLIR